jgi:hypothetical protein
LGGLSAIRNAVGKRSRHVEHSGSVPGAKGGPSHIRLGMVSLTDMGNDMTRGALASHEADHTETPHGKRLDGFARQEQVGSHAMSANSPSSQAATLTLRVAEARVEDVGLAVARLAPADLLRLGARAGDVLKITGGMTTVGRAELADEGHEGTIQIDGTCRSNCSVGLEEQVRVASIEPQRAVAVRLSPLWVGRPTGCSRIWWGFR